MKGFDHMTDLQSTPGLVEYAQYAMSQGWDPLPVWGVNADGVCACRNGLQCSSPGKHPIESEWQSRERLSVPDAYTWWQAPLHPINIGLRTGVVSGFWALDIDPRHDGDKSLLALEAQYGQLPRTRVHRTGSGGRHYLFRLPADFEVTNSRGRLPKGIDVRGNGGFIVAPGSTTGVGRYFTEVDSEVADAPGWLLDLIRPQTAESTVDVVDSVDFTSMAPEAQERARRYLDSALSGEVERLEAMRRDARVDMTTYRGEPWNETVYQVCCNLLELAQSQWLPFTVEDAKVILRDHAPTDPGFTMVDVLGRLNSAANKVRGKDRPMPSSILQDDWALLTAGLTSRYTQHLPKDEEGRPEPWPEDKWDQLGNARRTLRLASGRLLYVREAQRWFECGSNSIWASPRGAKPDDVAAAWCARAMEAAQTLELPAYDDAPTTDSKGKPGPSKREKFMAFMDISSKVEMHSAVATQLRRRADDFGVLASSDQFNSAPFDFAVANGVIDLRTGELHQARPEDFISIASEVSYDPEMRIPTFEHFLATSLPDPTVRAFLQRVLGYSMTSVTDEERMFIHFGPKGNNGKSVLMDVLKAILGGHMTAASSKTIIKQKGPSTRSGQDMIDLIGPRFLMLNETNEGDALDTEIVKSITTGDLRADRALYEGNQEYRITGKFHVSTNHLPHITPDDAMHRRIVIIPWMESFLGREDPNLRRKLQSELPGILAWLVRGAVSWFEEAQTSGRKVFDDQPQVCAEALASFFEDEDEIGDWFIDQVVPLSKTEDPKTWTSTKDLYQHYVNWRFTQALSGQAMSINAFGRRLTAKGYEQKQVRFGDARVKVRPIKTRTSLTAGILDHAALGR